jgi:hypothetical protein
MTNALLLKANNLDKSNWLKLFKPPVQPHTEEVFQEGMAERLFLLHSAEFDATSSTREVYDAGKAIVRRLNAIVTGIIGRSSVEASGTAVHTDGRWTRHLVTELEPVTFGFGLGVAEFEIFDKDGKPPAGRPNDSAEALPRIDARSLSC